MFLSAKSSSRHTCFLLTKCLSSRSPTTHLCFSWPACNIAKRFDMLSVIFLNILTDETPSTHSGRPADSSRSRYLIIHSYIAPGPNRSIGCRKELSRHPRTGLVYLADPWCGSPSLSLRLGFGAWWFMACITREMHSPYTDDSTVNIVFQENDS